MRRQPCPVMFLPSPNRVPPETCCPQLVDQLVQLPMPLVCARAEGNLCPGCLQAWRGVGVEDMCLVVVTVGVAIAQGMLPSTGTTLGEGAYCIVTPSVLSTWRYQSILSCPSQDFEEVVRVGLWGRIF